jgi:hypothetical protein
MNKFVIFGLAALTLSVYGDGPQVASSSDSISPKKQAVEKADAGPYQDDDDVDNTDGTDTEGDMEDDAQDDDVIQLDDEDSEDDSNYNQ